MYNFLINKKICNAILILLLKLYYYDKIKYITQILEPITIIFF